MRVVLSGGRPVPGRGRPGRGAWLCLGSPDCVEAALRRNSLGRALRTAVAPDAADDLRRLLGRLDQDRVSVWEDVRPRPVDVETVIGKD